MELDIPTVESKVEDESGVYTVRAEFSFGRLKGTSNIIYMGQTTKSLKKRLLGLLGKGQKHTARDRVKKLSDYKLFFEVEYTEDPKKLEKEKLDKYVSEHLETPPLNHAFKSKN